MNLPARLRRWLSALPVVLALLLAAGCVHIHVPRPEPADGVRIYPLSDHVEFLTQPALKGRKCRSLESGYVRRYLRRHFEAIGLTPWAETSGYDQSFGFGTNVVGVLRGSDQALSDQVVLVCANYDSLGVQNDKIHPGAADNAAGVAVMLQIAERLAANPEGLRRSVAFVALDCGLERYFGAFAFTLRKDFDPTKLVAVVNLDLLGRPNFDVIDDALIVVGTGNYPEIREVLDQAARHAASPATTRGATTTQAATQTAPAAFRILHGSSDILPPIADYFAFEQWQLPVLLLTNGLYSDYHKPTDTPDKLDYTLLQRDADVATYLVRNLASRQQLPAYVASRSGDRQELQSIQATLEDILAHADDLLLTPVEQHRLGQLALRAKRLLAQPDYSLADRKAFLVELAQKGAPSILRFFYAPPKPDPDKLFNARQLAAALSWYEFFATHRDFASYATQQVMRHFLGARGNLLRLLSSYTFASCNIRRDEIVYTHQTGDLHRLSFIYPLLRIQAGISTREFDVRYAAVDVQGTPVEIVDTVLLYWAMGEQDCMAKVMPTALSAVTGLELGDRRDSWLAWRLAQASAVDEEQWQRHLWQSRNPDLLKALLQKAAENEGPEPPEAELRRIITDRQMRGDVRLDAIAALPPSASRDSLLALVDVLDDTTFVPPRQYVPAFDTTFPFYEHVGMREARMRTPPRPATTVGLAAQSRLKALTGLDFAGDIAAWRQSVTTSPHGRR